MAWWDEPDDTVDRNFVNNNVNTLSALYGGQRPVAQGPVTQSGQRPVVATTPAPTRPRPSQNVPTQQQAQQQNSWAGVGQQLAQQLYGQPATSPVRRPSSNVVYANQDVPTRQQAQQQNSWAGVINRLRPALTQPVNRVVYDVKPTVVGYGRPQVDTGATGIQASTVMQPTTNVQATRLRDYRTTAPKDEQYYTQNQPPVVPTIVPMGVPTGGASLLVNQIKQVVDQLYPKDDNKYTWTDMLKDNLGGLWDSAGNRMARDWSDTWEAGKGNFYNPTAEAKAIGEQQRTASTNNQAILKRAYELQEIYAQSQYNSLQRAAQFGGGPQPDRYDLWRGGIALEPFIAQAQKELGQTMMESHPFMTPLAQAQSFVSGLAGNSAQVPGLLQYVPGLEGSTVANLASPGGAVNVIGNVLGTAVDALATGTRSLVAPYPVQVVPEDVTKAGNPLYLSAGEIVGAAMDAAINPSQWWTNPSAWTFQKNPLTLYSQVWGDNMKRTLDTIYSLGPSVGDQRTPVTGEEDGRYLRAIGTANLDFSGPQSQQNYVDSVLNKDKKLAELDAQYQAARQAAENVMLPQDVRDNNALIASQTYQQAEMLRNADAIALAEQQIKPLRDAIGSALLDPTLWYDLASMLDPKTFAGLSPQARQLRATEKVLQRSNEEIAKVVGNVVEQTGERSWMYGALWEGGLSRVGNEVKEAQRFAASILSNVSEKTDIPKIFQYIVDNPQKFATDGLPANLVTSPRLRSLANDAGLIEFPNIQMQEKDFQYLFNSLKSFSGQFGRLPALALEKGNVSDVIQDLVGAVEIQSAVRNKVSPFLRGVPLGTTTAEIETATNAAGDLIYKTVYKDKEGQVLARYLAPSEGLAQKEVQLANANIKAGKYLDRNFLDMATRFYRNSFSQQVLVTVPGAWVNNAIGGLLTGFTTASNTLVKGDEILRMAERLFPNGAPFEYLLRDATGQVITKENIFEKIPKVKDAAAWLRSIRGGHTEIPLVGGRSIKFGENAFKAGAWYKGVQRALGQTLDTDWRQIGEPIMAAMQLDPGALRAVRTFVDRLANDADIKTFYDNLTQYAIGRKQTLDVAGTVGKVYDTVLSERQLWPQVEGIIEQASGDMTKFKQLWTELLDGEIAKVADTAGYDATLTTIPHSTTGDIAEMLRDTTVSIEQLARDGIQIGPDAQTLNQAIAGVRDHIQRVWALATNARTPEAIQQAELYASTLRQLHRDVQEELGRLMRHAKSTNLPADWQAYHQARLTMYNEYAQRAVQEGERMLMRVMGQEVEEAAVPAIASIDTVTQQAEEVLAAPVEQVIPASVVTDAVEQATPIIEPATPPTPRQVVQHTFPEDISGFDTSDYGKRGWLYSNRNFQEAQHFFRRAEQIYRDTFMRVAQQTGDLRSMDIFLQTQDDINRLRGEFFAGLDVARREMQDVLAAGGDRAAAYKKFYTLKAEGHVELAEQVNAKLKAATAYLQNLPEPIAFRHSAYGDVAIIGYSTDGVAIRLSNGQVAVVAEDAIPLSTMQKVTQRQQMLKAGAQNPLASAAVEGIPENFAKAVDKRAEQYYKDLLTSRNAMYTATPNVSDAVGDQILLLYGLRNKAAKLADSLATSAKQALDPKQVAGLVDYATHIRQQFPKYAEAASTYGDFLQSKHMIDFRRTYRADQLLSIAFPFSFWNTRTMKNMFERIATQPAYRHLMDIESAFFEQTNNDSNKEYVTVNIGGRDYKIYASLGKYMTSVGDYSADPTYYEKRSMDGPLGWVYAIEAATGTGSYPYIDATDNWLRKHVTGQEDTNPSFWESSGWNRLGWNVANYFAGVNLVKNLPWAFTDRDSGAINTNLSVKVNEGQLTQRQATLAKAVLEDYLYGTGFPEKTSKAQIEEGTQILNSALIEHYGWSAMTGVIQAITGQTVAAPQPGLQDLRQAQDDYFSAEYPGNPGGGTMAQRAIREQNPGIASYWDRFRLDNDERETAQSEPLGVQARRMEYQEKLDKIYEQQSDAVTTYILSKAGTVAPYKEVQAIEKKYAEERNKLKAEYADLPEQTFGPRNLDKMNTYERSLYQLEQILRYDGKEPEYPGEDATPEERVKAFADRDAWERARLDYIELTLNALDVTTLEGDPKASAIRDKLETIVQDQYASELVRKYLDLKYAGRVERQWSEFSSLEKEMDSYEYQARAENVTARLGKDTTYQWKVYQNQVNEENKAKYLNEHPDVSLAITAAYNPDAWDEGIRLFGQDTWTTYKAYKNAKPTYPEGGSEQQVQDYYKKLDAVQKQYPQAKEIEFWIDGRYRWWNGTGDQAVRSAVPGTGRDGRFGWDYQQAQELFGEDIFDVERAFPSGGSKKQIAQFYDKYPQYGAYRAWLKQYQMPDADKPLSINDLPTFDPSQLPAQQPDIPASIPPYWTQYTQTSRPFGSGREPINETPEQKQQRLVLEARFQQAQAQEKARQAAIKAKGRAATIDSQSWQDKVVDAYQQRYGRSSRSTRRYYSGGRRGGGGRYYRSGGGGGGGYFSSPGTDPSINPALWQQPRRDIAQLNGGNSINPSLWGSLLEKLKRPGK